MLILSLTIFCLLTFATLFVNVSLKSRASQELVNNRKRIHTWWLISLICIPVFYLGSWILNILVFSLIIWAAVELTRMQNKHLNPVLGILLLCVAFAYSMALKQFPDLNRFFYLLPLLLLVIFFRIPGNSPLRLYILLLYCITSLETILLINQQTASEGYNSGLILLYLFLITALNDIFQYLCGKQFGKRALIPNISPNKTVEGAAGGILLSGLVASISMPLVTHINWLPALMVGTLVSGLGIVGDLSISCLKRQADIKNTGSSMPGHGGLLDRIDSLAMTAPVFGLCLSLHVQGWL